MDSLLPKVVRDLSQQRRWHAQQIDHIDAALRNLSPTEEPPFPLEPTRWSSEIDKVFEEHDDLLPREVIKLLVQNGVRDADLWGRKTNVYATLNRKVGQGLLEKTQENRYRRVNK